MHFWDTLWDTKTDFFVYTFLYTAENPALSAHYFLIDIQNATPYVIF